MVRFDNSRSVPGSKKRTMEPSLSTMIRPVVPVGLLTSTFGAATTVVLHMSSALQRSRAIFMASPLRSTRALRHIGQKATEYDHDDPDTERQTSDDLGA